MLERVRGKVYELVRCWCGTAVQLGVIGSMSATLRMTGAAGRGEGRRVKRGSKAVSHSLNSVVISAHWLCAAAMRRLPSLAGIVAPSADRVRRLARGARSQKAAGCMQSLGQALPAHQNVVQGKRSRGGAGQGSHLRNRLRFRRAEARRAVCATKGLSLSVRSGKDRHLHFAEDSPVLCPAAIAVAHERRVEVGAAAWLAADNLPTRALRIRAVVLRVRVLAAAAHLPGAVQGEGNGAERAQGGHVSFWAGGRHADGGGRVLQGA